MLALYEKEMNDLKKVSIQYDHSTRTYYCFYQRNDNLLLKLILSYNINECKWNVDTDEYRNIFEKNINDLFYNKIIPFEEQIRYVISYLDMYFMNQIEQEKKFKTNFNYYPWLQRLRGIRRWVSQDTLTEQLPVLQRYSAPEKSTYTNNNEQIISVKALAESFYTDNIFENRPKSFHSSSEYSKKHNSIRLIPQIPNKPPPITEVWLNVTTEKINNFEENFTNHIKEEKLKKLADKFVTYFGGTFQCNIGHQYQLEYDYHIWHFTILKVEFLKNKTCESTKNLKTKIIFLINNIPYYVRG